MSEAAVRERVRKQGWAAPGGFHDRLVRFLKVALPMSIGVLTAFLLLAPLSKGNEISFLLDKTKVAVAQERMRVQAASYRGQDTNGRPFEIDARQAVQATSADPIVDIMGMAARIRLADGPAVLRTDQARYNLETEKVQVPDAITVRTADGYQLDTSDVVVDLNARTLTSQSRVEGRMPLGRFSADRMTADLPSRVVRLTGNARLYIVQGGIR